MRAGADPDTPYVNDEGKSHNLLMDSIIVENADFALHLIEQGAHMYYMDDHHATTLLQTSQRGITNIIDALLDKHAGAPKAGEEGWVGNASDEGVTSLLAASSEEHVPCFLDHLGWKFWRADSSRGDSRPGMFWGFSASLGIDLGR